VLVLLVLGWNQFWILLFAHPCGFSEFVCSFAVVISSSGTVGFDCVPDKAAAHVLVEGGGVVLVGREGRAALRCELGKPAQDHDLDLVRPQALEQRPPLASWGPGGEGRVGVGGEVDVLRVTVADGGGVVDHGFRSDRKIGGGLELSRD
jgi:hypothetical protein